MMESEELARVVSKWLGVACSWRGHWRLTKGHDDIAENFGGVLRVETTPDERTAFAFNANHERLVSAHVDGLFLNGVCYYCLFV